MYVQTVRNIDDLHIDKNEWNSLVIRDRTGSIFQTYEWFKCWWDTFGSEGELLILLAKDEAGAVIGIAPLTVVRKLHNRIVMFCGYNNADYCDFIVPDKKVEIINQFLTVLRSAEIQWDRLCLSNLPDESRTEAIIRDYYAGTCFTFAAYPSTPAPYLAIGDNPDAAKQIIEKYSVMRRYRALKKRGTLVFKPLRGGDIDEYLPLFFEQHVARWSDKKGESLFCDYRNRRFYTELAEALSQTDWGAFTVLECDGRPVGFHYGFVFKNKLLWYKPTYDVEYSKYSPGVVMTKYLIRSAIESHLDEVDFTIGNEAFKQRFTTGVRHNHNIVIFRRKIGYLFVMFSRHLRAMIKFLVLRMRH